ncbi:MAG: hypothetical protein J6D28_06435 [Bacilli bacterium]|nr:hypothetical protein [Bacilli bacterium]
MKIYDTENELKKVYPAVPNPDGFSFVGDNSYDYEIRDSFDPNKLLLFRKDGRKLSNDDRIPQGFLQAGISIAVMEKEQNDEFFGNYEISNFLTEDSQYLVIEFKVKSYENDVREKGTNRFVKKIFHRKK